MSYTTIVMTTETDAHENLIPYVTLTIDDEKIGERIRLVEKLTSKGRRVVVKPVSVSFWSDAVVWIEWHTKLPSKWLGAREMRRLEKQGVLYTDKAIDFDNPINDFARVEAVMSVFWDEILTVESLDKQGFHYEGRVVFFRELLARIEDKRLTRGEEE